MALESLCLYNKFGHCKFSETCRKLHNKEICRNKTCEIQHCTKRHPRPCKYFQEYKRCKFGEFCSFSHDSEYHIHDHVPNNVTTDIQNRLEMLENKIKEKDNQIENLIEEIDAIKKENTVAKEELSKALEKVVNPVVKEITETLIKTFSQKQDDLEQRTTATLDSLHEQLTMLSNVLLSPSNSQPRGSQSTPKQSLPLSSNVSQQSQQPRNQCKVCGKTFGSHRALTNHIRNDHEPIK